MRHTRILRFFACLLGSLAAEVASAGVLRVTDFGAVCDGVVDDRAAIQAAIDAASTAGGRVLFPSGTCMSSGDLVVSNATGVYLEGMGRGVSVVKRMEGTYAGWNSLIRFANAHDSGLRGLTVDGNRFLAVGGVQAAVSISVSTGIELTDLEFVEHFTCAVRVSGSSASWTERVTISNSRFFGISDCAIYLHPYWSDVVVDGNVFEAVDGRTIHYYGGEAEGLILTKNAFREGPGGEAIFFSWGRLLNSVISENTLENGSIVSYSLGLSTISNNHISNSGIRFKSGVGEPVTVANNTIDSPTGYGISVSGTSGTAWDAVQVTITGNRILSDYGGVSMTVGKNVSIVGNSIAPVTSPIAGAGYGVTVWGLKPIESLLIANNQIAEMKWGIRVGPYSTYPYDVDTVLVTGNVIRSGIANAGGVSIAVGPNGQGAMTVNYQVEGNLEVFPTPNP